MQNTLVMLTTHYNYDVIMCSYSILMASRLSPAQLKTITDGFVSDRQPPQVIDMLQKIQKVFNFNVMSDLIQSKTNKVN